MKRVLLENRRRKEKKKKRKEGEGEKGKKSGKRLGDRGGYFLWATIKVYRHSISIQYLYSFFKPKMSPWKLSFLKIMHISILYSSRAIDISCICTYIVKIINVSLIENMYPYIYIYIYANSVQLAFCICIRHRESKLGNRLQPFTAFVYSICVVDVGFSNDAFNI